MNQISASPPIERLFTRRDRSQAAVEFAVTFPIFLMIIFGIIDFSLLLAAWLNLQHMTRQAVRYAATYQYNPAYCTTNLDNDGSPPCKGQSEYDEIDLARLPSIKDVFYANDFLVFQGPSADKSQRGYLKVTICSARDRNGDGMGDYFKVSPIQGQVVTPPFDPNNHNDGYAHCKLNGVPAEDAGGQNNYVFVMADFNHPFLTPFISFTWPYFHLAAERQAVVGIVPHHAPAFAAAGGLRPLADAQPHPHPHPHLHRQRHPNHHQHPAADLHRNRQPGRFGQRDCG